MKKLIFATVILIFGVCAMAYLYFAGLNNDTNKEQRAIHIASAEATLVFAYQNDKTFYDIVGGQNLFAELLGAEKWKSFSYIFSQAWSKQIAQFFKENTVYIGFVPQDKNVDFIIATTVADNFNIASKLKNLRPTTLKNTSKAFKITADSINIFIAIKDNTIAIANNSATLEKSFGNNETLTPFGDYIAKQKPQSNALANLYINFGSAKTMAQSLIETKVNGRIDFLNQLQGFASLTYNFGTDKLLFNGYTSFAPDDYFNLFLEEGEQKIEADKILPVNTANFSYFAISDYNRWAKKWDSYLDKKGFLKKKQQEIKAINQRYGIDLQDVFPKYFKGQSIAFQTSTGERYGCVWLNNGDKLNQLLLDLTADYAPNIRIFKDEDILFYYFGRSFDEFDRSFFTIIDNYLVCANNASSIQSFLNNYTQSHFLTTTENYKAFSDQLSSSATLMLYINHTNSSNLFGRNLRNAIWKQYKEPSGLGNYNAACYQLSADKEHFLSNLLLSKSKPKLKDAIN